MAPHATEVAAMARQAGLLVVRNLSGRMEIDEIASVVRRAQVDPSEMAFLATERIVDLGVANQAVRHERKVSLVCQIGLPNTPMARLAGIPGIEMLPCAAGFLLYTRPDSDPGLVVRFSGTHLLPVPAAGR